MKLYEFTITDRLAISMQAIQQRAKDCAAAQEAWEVQCEGSPWPPYQIRITANSKKGVFHVEVHTVRKPVDDIGPWPEDEIDQAWEPVSLVVAVCLGLLLLESC